MKLTKYNYKKIMRTEYGKNIYVTDQQNIINRAQKITLNKYIFYDMILNGRGSNITNYA